MKTFVEKFINVNSEYEKYRLHDVINDKYYE